MAKSDVLTLRINTNLKREGNELLDEMGLTPSSFVSMAYSQLVRERALPFEVKAAEQLSLGMTQEEFSRMERQWISEMSNGGGTPVNEVFDELNHEFGLSTVKL